MAWCDPRKPALRHGGPDVRWRRAASAPAVVSLSAPSSIDVELTLDGKTVDAGRMRFHINDRDYELDALADHETEFWFVLHTALLRVSDVLPGTHDVELRLDLRIPYLFDEQTGDVLVTRHQAPITVTVPDDATA